VKTLSNTKTLTISFFIIGIFLLIETVGGIVANSLALLADAGHMLSDFLAILLSLIAQKYLCKPANKKHSYGYRRMQIIASFINGITLVVISIVIIITAVMRIFEPPVVEADIMLIVSAIGIVVNGITLYILDMSEEKNLNMKGAILHIVGDLLGFIAALIGSILIKYTDLFIIDPLLSVIISLLILNSAVRLIKDSIHILLEGAPSDIREEEIRNALVKEIEGVIDVHHIHIWLLDDTYKMVTLHLILDKDCDPFKVVKNSQELLTSKYKINHATLAVERYNPQEHETRDYNHHHKEITN
jgi:cobalt-zinc-cadmium efflux system protein